MQEAGSNADNAAVPVQEQVPELELVLQLSFFQGEVPELALERGREARFPVRCAYFRSRIHQSDFKVVGHALRLGGQQGDSNEDDSNPQPAPEAYCLPQNQL